MIEEEVARIATPAHSFDEMFELSMRFLSSPCEIWEKGDLKVKKTVLRLVFSSPLNVSRKTGVQTRETTYPFKALAYLDKTNKNVVPAAGLEPARPYGQEILSLMCLPFHHAGSHAGLAICRTIAICAAG